MIQPVRASADQVIIAPSQGNLGPEITAGWSRDKTGCARRGVRNGIHAPTPRQSGGNITFYLKIVKYEPQNAVLYSKDYAAELHGG